MNRRAAMRLLPGLMAFQAADLLAQPATKVPVIGVPLITAGPNDGIMIALRRGLRERGYYRWREHSTDTNSRAPRWLNACQRCSMTTLRFALGV